MYTQKIPDSVKELLSEPYFILWCYGPTEESETWIENWIARNPGREKDLSEAREILLSVEMNKIAFPTEESEKLYLRILNSAHQNKKRKRRKTIAYSIAAACVVCIFMSGLWMHIQRNDNSEELYMVQQYIKIDSLQTEIELELGGNEKVKIENKQTIKLDDTGTIYIEDEKITQNNTDQEEEYQSSKVTTNTNMNVLRVPRGRHTAIYLSDGSRVWINSETVLQFPAVFGKDHRTIYADGEIYIEVAKDTSRPFYVKTSQMDIRVLGTSFNVTAYSDETTQSVVLKEGQVEVSTGNGMRSNLAPNERLVYEDNRIDVKKVDPYYYFSWIDGVFLFERQNLKDIALRVSRYYKVNIICSPQVENYMSTGKLVLFDDINKVLTTLHEMFPISSSIEGDTIKLNTNSKTSLPMK